VFYCLEFLNFNALSQNNGKISNNLLKKTTDFGTLFEENALKRLKQVALSCHCIHLFTETNGK
jgi:hypothetical protein